MDELKEELAEYAHDSWSKWMAWLFKKSKLNADGTCTIPEWVVNRWLRQSRTDYGDLPEVEKDSDRDEAEKMLKIFESPTKEMERDCKNCGTQPTYQQRKDECEGCLGIGN